MIEAPERFNREVIEFLERYMRDAKLHQICEGTNQIQRLVIANELLH